MKRSYWFSLLFLSMNIALVSFYPKKEKIISTGINSPEFLFLDEEIKSFMVKWKIPGGSLAFIEDGKVVYTKGFGYADSGKTPVTSDHLFRIASLSKPITALAVMKLVQQQKLSLNSIVFGKNGILNDIKYQDVKDERILTITIRQLLEHTGGWDRAISSCGDPMFDPLHIAQCMNKKAPASSGTIIQYMLSKRLDHDPGTFYSYSNFGYSVLGRVIEKISGIPYENFIKNELLFPMGITGMELAKNELCNRRPNEVCYFDTNEKISSVCRPGEEVPFPYGGFNVEAMDAHGGWLASASQLGNFLTRMKSQLDIELFNDLFFPSNCNSNYAKGWSVNAKGNCWHTGSLVGSSSMMALVKNKTMGWVLLFNFNPGTSEYFFELDKVMWRAIQKNS